MKKLVTVMLLFVAFVCSAQTISKNTVKVQETKKLITISASAIPAKTNVNWTSDIPVSITWDLVYTNKTYYLSKNSKPFYQSTEVDGVRSAYKAELLKFNNINQ